MHTTHPYWGSRLIVTILLLAFTVSACTTATDGGSRVYKIGILNVNTATQQVLDSYIEGMKKLGYTNSEFIYLGPPKTGAAADIDARLNELLARNVDLLFVMNTGVAIRAQQLKTTVPIVFAAVYDPVDSKIVPERGIRKGSNITGILHGISEAKRTEWFTRVAPSAKVLYVPFNPKDASAVKSLVDIKEAAAKLNLKIMEMPCITDLTKNCGAEDVKALFAKIPDEVTGIMCPADPVIVGQIKTIVEVSIAKKLPVSVIGHPDVEAGALFSYGFNFRKIGPQAARISDQILRGAVSPGDIPIETAELDLFINLETASKIGVMINKDVLVSASTIIRPTATAPGNASVTPNATPTSMVATNTVIPATNTAIPPTHTAIPPPPTAIPPTETALPVTSTSLPPTNTALPPTNTELPPTATP
jgi:putative ABC transport system substrate-binding protein